MHQRNNPMKWQILVGLVLLALPISAQPLTFDPNQYCAGIPLEDVVIDSTQVLDLPASGILCYRNFTVEGGVEVRFRRNALNTPVHILATENIVIAGLVDLQGRSANGGSGGLPGPGGFRGGNQGVDGVSEPGAGQGPGGGLGGTASFPGGGGAAYGTLSNLPSIPTDGQIYGSALLMPLVGGSGGGGGRGNPGTAGGGGGGAILLAANGEISLSGRVTTDGGQSPGTGDGSGGAIRVVAPKVAGSGSLNARGGRARIDTFDSSELEFYVAGASSLGSFVVAFPDPLPRLDILHVAGQEIPEGTPNGVVVHLPPGSDPLQLVRVQALDFPEPVTVEVVAVPNSGTPRTESAIAAAGSGSVEVLIEIPENTITHVFAWIR